MVLLTRHEESIKARLCFVFSINLSKQSFYQFISIISFNHLSIFSFISFNSCSVSSSLHLSKSFCSKLSLPRKVFCSKTCAIHLFHSLLPLPKRIRQGLTARILFVSLFSLFQKNEGLTA